MNNPFRYTPHPVCDAAFRDLLSRIEILKRSDSDADRNLCRELEEGKMLGVLIAADASGQRHTLYAFSGQLGDNGFYHPDFVDGVFDYLRPDGYFREREMDISRQSDEIRRFEEGELTERRKEYEEEREEIEAGINLFKEKCRRSKQERDARRASGEAGEAELEAMIGKSQFEKAELRRMKKRGETLLAPFRENLERAQARLAEMKERRKTDSEQLQQWLFDNFKVLDALGESWSLSEIFASTPLRVPPSGAGECCAPKLLQAAYLRRLTPLWMSEYWYGKPRGGEVRIHGCHYPACRGKCLPVLRRMLRGLDVEPPLDCEPEEPAMTPRIVYENEWFCVIDKPAGMLSVPGKGSALSLQEWLALRYGEGREVKMAHRLDQDTSGLIVATFGISSFQVMQSLFATRRVRKTYIADLDGDYRTAGLPRRGRIELPLAPDWLDRPRQCVDHERGKEAVTEYEFSEVEEGRSRVEFHPLTGRTHQLRVHAASSMGLGLPISGDRLYGNRPSKDDLRLHLHAQKIEFTFPFDGKKYCFESDTPF